MKTLVIQAEDALIEKIASFFELFPKNRYDIKIFSNAPAGAETEMSVPIVLKWGAAKGMITYIADDFDAPLEANDPFVKAAGILQGRSVNPMQFEQEMRHE